MRHLHPCWPAPFSFLLLHGHEEAFFRLTGLGGSIVVLTCPFLGDSGSNRWWRSTKNPNPTLQGQQMERATSPQARRALLVIIPFHMILILCSFLTSAVLNPLELTWITPFFCSGYSEESVSPKEKERQECHIDLDLLWQARLGASTFTAPFIDDMNGSVANLFSHTHSICR